MPSWIYLFCYYVDGDSRLYRITRFFVPKVKASFCSNVLGLHRVFFYSLPVCSNCLRFSDFETLILKYLKKFSLSSFKRPKNSVKFCFPFSFSNHYKSSIFAFLAFILKEDEAHMQNLSCPPHNDQCQPLKNGSSGR